MGKFELYGGMFLDWEGRGELQMEHGMGSGRDNYDRGGGGRWEGEMGGGSGRTYGKVGGDGDDRVMIQFVAHLWVCPL